MAAAAALTLKNAAASNVTFDVYSVNADSVEWVESGATSILGMIRAFLGRKIPTDRANGVYRTLVKSTYPVVNETTGALDGTVTVNSEILRPAKLASADVDEAVARHAALFSLTIVKQAAETGAIPT
jgi:hypothetical protein